METREIQRQCNPLASQWLLPARVPASIPLVRQLAEELSAIRRREGTEGDQAAAERS